MRLRGSLPAAGLRTSFVSLRRWEWPRVGAGLSPERLPDRPPPVARGMASGQGGGAGSLLGSSRVVGVGLLWGRPLLAPKEMPQVTRPPAAG